MSISVYNIYAEQEDIMTLHGIYDHGKIELLDEDLPDIRTDVEIEIQEDIPDNIARRKKALHNIQKIIRENSTHNIEKWTRESILER